MRAPVPALLFFASALTLAGCMPIVTGIATPMIIQQEHVNVTNASYAAVDSMVQQSGKRLTRERPLIVLTLQEIVDTGNDKVIKHPKVGQALSEQMRERFLQLGYNLVETPAHRGNGPMEVSGTYEFVNSGMFSGKMLVSLRLSDRSTGQVVTVYNYSLPVTYEIKKHMTGNAHMLPPLL